MSRFFAHLFVLILMGIAVGDFNRCCCMNYGANQQNQGNMQQDGNMGGGANYGANQQNQGNMQQDGNMGGANYGANQQNQGNMQQGGNMGGANSANQQNQGNMQQGGNMGGANSVNQQNQGNDPANGQQGETPASEEKEVKNNVKLIVDSFLKINNYSDYSSKVKKLMNKRGIEDKLKKLRQDLAELQESLDGTKGEPQVTDAGPQTVKEQGEISKTAKKHDVQRVRSRGGYPRGVYTVKSYGSYMEQASPRSCTTKSHEKGKQVYGNYEGSGSYRARNHTIKSYARGAGKSAYGNYESSGSYGARNHTVKSYARGAGKSSDGRSSIAYRVKSYGSSAKDDAPGGVPPQTQAEHKYTVKSIGGSGSQKYFQSDCCK